MEKINAELIIFDLDGTLIDSSRDIAWCANKTLAVMGHKEMEVREIVGHIGWGVKPLLEKLMPTESRERIMEARQRFLEFYGGHLVVDTTIYPGVPETIERLVESGKKLAIVTNKPEGLAEGILGILDMRKPFLMVVGGDSLPNRKPHPEPIEKVIRDLKALPAKTVVIGDSPVDCEAGKAAGAFAIGVSYGFRGKAELEASGCDLIVDTFPQLKEVLA